MTTNAAIISIKIFIQKTGATKTLRLAGDMSCHEAIKEIQEKETAGAGGKDHGLFLPHNKETGKKRILVGPKQIATILWYRDRYYSRVQEEAPTY